MVGWPCARRRAGARGSTWSPRSNALHRRRRNRPQGNRRPIWEGRFGLTHGTCGGHPWGAFHLSNGLLGLDHTGSQGSTFRHHLPALQHRQCEILRIEIGFTQILPFPNVRAVPDMERSISDPATSTTRGDGSEFKNGLFQGHTSPLGEEPQCGAHSVLRKVETYLGVRNFSDPLSPPPMQRS
jgi:hypothetical protein